MVVIGAVLVWAGLVALALRGWHNRGRRQETLIGTLPVAPEHLGEPVLGPDTGLYVGSTLAPSWQNRVAVGDVGDRASASITAYADGILIERRGASEIWIPRRSITAVRTERGLAGKVMTADGVLVIRWVLPTGTEIDSGLRADDKASYPGWVAQFAVTPPQTDIATSP
ncbi:MAG: transporter [Gordonia sp. (in: high G+C Gram-positive bacteria)]